MTDKKTNNPIVDTHVLLLPNTNRIWWAECQASLRDEPIRLHLAEGIEGHIGKGRAKAFMMGNSEYISCIDPDDMVIPGAYAACIEALEQHPEACGAYTDELLIDEDGRTIKPGIWSGRDWNPLLQLEPKYLHHVYVIRRRFAEPHLEELNRWPNMAEYVLKCLVAAYGPWIHVNRFGYKWRLHGEGQGHKRFPLMGAYAARWRVIPTLQRAAQKYGHRLHPPEKHLSGRKELVP